MRAVTSRESLLVTIDSSVLNILSIISLVLQMGEGAVAEWSKVLLRENIKEEGNPRFAYPHRKVNCEEK